MGIDIDMVPLGSGHLIRFMKDVEGSEHYDVPRIVLTNGDTEYEINMVGHLGIRESMDDILVGIFDKDYDLGPYEYFSGFSGTRRPVRRNVFGRTEVDIECYHDEHLDGITDPEHFEFDMEIHYSGKVLTIPSMYLTQVSTLYEDGLLELDIRFSAVSMADSYK